MTPYSERGHSTVLALVAAALLLGLSGHVAAQDKQDDDDDDKNDKPKFTLRLTPRVGFGPLRVTAVARLDGGADDYEEYYCAAVEWDWGDGTISRASADCDPYEAGTSEIRRSFRSNHTYRESGQHEVQLSLIRNDKTVEFVSGAVEVRASLRPQDH